MSTVASQSLNPALFEALPTGEYTVKPEIREKLLEIASEFINYLAEDGLELDVVDIRLVGSNAGYDYQDTSDIDLHLVADLDNLCCDDTIVQVALNAEKQRFNNTYDITVKGIPVEVYVEDVRTGVNSCGIFSLARGGWVKYPVPADPIPDKFLAEIEEKFGRWTNIINAALSRKHEKELQRIINRLYLMRKDGLDTVGINSCGNQIFKKERAAGLLDALKQAKDEAISERLTMECRIAQEALSHGSFN